MREDLLTLLWQSLTDFSDVVELLDDGYFLNVGDDEWDAIGDTVDEAEAELRRVAADPEHSMDWDYHFMRGTELLCQVETLAEPW